MIDPAAGFLPFVRIVEAGSISVAARELGVPRATLSRQLAALEHELGVRLLHRSTRRLVPTPAGEELFRRARLVVQQAEEARQAVARLDGVPRGLLRVSVPPGLAADLLADTVLTYLERYPEVRVELSATSRHVDLVAEGIDVAVRAGRLDDPTLIARRLLVMSRLAVASPDYLAGRGVPRTPDDLAAHDCILGFDRGEVPARTWPLCEGGTVAVSGRIVTNTVELVQRAALAGRGVALLAENFVDDALRDGRLVHVLPGLVGDSTAVALVYPSREHLDPKVRLFIDLAAADLLSAWASRSS